MLGDDPSCLWQRVCSDRCCRNTSLFNTSLQGKNKRSQGSWAVSADRNVCLWVEMQRNLEKKQPPPFFGKKEIAL